MKEDTLEHLVKSLVKDILAENKKEIEEKWEDLQRNCVQRTDKVDRRLDRMEADVLHLEEKLAESRK